MRPTIVLCERDHLRIGLTYDASLMGLTVLFRMIIADTIAACFALILA